MAHPTLEYIMGLRKQLETKKAEIVGQDPDTMPGAENNKPVPEGAKSPDPETRDGTMVPNSGLSTSGAGDDSKITHTNDLGSEEPVLTPKNEPMETADAFKSAEALAREVIESITAYEQRKTAKKAEDCGKPDSATSEELVTDKGTEPAQTAEVTPPAKEPMETDNAEAEPPAHSSSETADAAKSAGALDLELTSDVLAKIAAVILATEEGTEFAENMLAKTAGAEAAAKTIGFLREQSDLAEKQAEYEAGARQAEYDILKMAQDAGAADAEAAIMAAQGAEGAGEQPAADGSQLPDVEEIASTLDEMVQSGEITEDEADQVVAEIAQMVSGDGEKTAAFLKAAQAEDPSAAIDATVGVDPASFDPASVTQDPVDDISPDDFADALDSLVASGTITEDEADELVQQVVAGDGESAEGPSSEAGGDVSPEDVATILQEAVQSGELTPEDVQAVLSELEGTPAPEAAPEAPAPEAPEAPAPEAPATDEPKTAAHSILAAIRAARRK